MTGCRFRPLRDCFPSASANAPPPCTPYTPASVRGGSPTLPLGSVSIWGAPQKNAKKRTSTSTTQASKRLPRLTPEVWHARLACCSERHVPVGPAARFAGAGSCAGGGGSREAALIAVGGGAGDCVTACTVVEETCPICVQQESICTHAVGTHTLHRQHTLWNSGSDSL